MTTKQTAADRRLQSPSLSAGNPHALVIGGSLGGLCAGECLRAAGWRVSIFERSPGVEPCLAVGVEHLQEIKPHRFRNRRQHDDKKGELQPARRLHKRVSLELFGMNHRDEQIREQQDSNQPDNEIFHEYP